MTQIKYIRGISGLIVSKVKILDSGPLWKLLSLHSLSLSYSF